jgi:phosphatidylglycerophosphatase A
VVALVAALGAVPVCTSAEHMFGQRDDRRIVADEYLTFPIAVLGLPLEQHPVGWLLGAFVLVRLLDIVKPWPARPLERCPGGWGIVLDDVVAASYACALLHGITRGLLPLVRGG